MSKSSNLPLYLQVAESIRRQILSGELEAGSHIPSVRSIAQEWNCTPGTIGRAYKVLAREGLVAGHSGKGTIVAESVSVFPQPAVGWASLIHNAESFLLEGIQNGFALSDGEVAVSLAAAHLRESLSRGAPPPQSASLDSSSDLQFTGSHDLLIEVVAGLLLDQKPPFALSVNYSGSLGGLIAMARGEADLCGIHLWDSVSNSYNIPFVLRVLPGRRILLLTLAHRYLGLIVPPGNPDRIANLADLARPDCFFVNRQSGSGTRVWLDGKLQVSGIPQEDIPGYDRVESTHNAVADAVAQGEASVGLGIHAAAASHGLDFIQLTRERYEIAIPEEGTNRQEVQALIELVRSRPLKQAIQLLGGYDDSQTGRMRWVP